MISKLLVLAFVAAVATASEATEQAAYVLSVHDDSWCHSHHLGEGATHCVSNNGCCFSEKISKIFEVMSFDDRLASEFGPCHSCVAHKDGWCQAFGAPNPNGKGKEWDECVANSGCTWSAGEDGAEGKCHRSSDKTLVTEHSCAAQLADKDARLPAFNACLDMSVANQEAAEATFVTSDTYETKRDLPNYRAFLNNPSECSFEKGSDQRTIANGCCYADEGCGCMELYTYAPECTEGNVFAASQQDSIPHVNGKDKGQYFCVDKQGHEIPNTRKQEPLNTPGATIDCNHFRDMHSGYQCPNAMVLSSSGGVVQVNKANNALDCRQDCVNDKDCGDSGWCCFNGCAYTCQKPVKPFTGCADPPVQGPSKTLAAVGEDSCVIGDGGCKGSHEMEVIASCAEGYSVAQNKGLPESVLLTCSHGRWLTGFGEENFELDCEKQCDPFDIEDVGSPSIIDDLVMNRDDFVIEGDENFFGSKRVITCVYNYGVVAGSESVLKTGADVLECGAKGLWGEKFTGNKRSIECSVCFDASTAAWTDGNGNNCQHYQSRPAECLKGEIGDGGTSAGWLALTPAQKNCRVACRTCRAAEAKFGVKDTRTADDIPGANETNFKNWKKISVKVIRTKYKDVSETKFVTVTKHLPLSQACQKDGEPTLEAALIDGEYQCYVDKDGNDLEEGYAIAGEAPSLD